jgi:hypothetical protein
MIASKGGASEPADTLRLVEGRNLAIEFRWAEGHYDRLAELATDLVRSRVEVIATSGGDIVVATGRAISPVAIRWSLWDHGVSPAANRRPDR